MSDVKAGANGRGPLSETVETFVEGIEAGDDRVGALADRAGRSGLIPIMTFAALLIVSPLSGVPLMSSVFGFIIAITAMQAVFGRKTLWLPGFLSRCSVPRENGRRALGSVARISAWIEARATERLTLLTTPPASRFFLVLATLYGCMMPFLEVVPMTASLLGLAVALIGLGLMLRDGVLLVLATIPPVAAAIVIWLVLLS